MFEAKSPRMMPRRVILGATAVVGVGAAAGWMIWSHPSFAGQAMSVTDAHRAAVAGEVFLIDIRRPDEWKSTGVGEGAHPIDMRRKDFVEVLDTVTGGDRSARVALICARGVRSARLSNRLSEAGYTNIINVPEGMLGSGAGPGWLASELPVKNVEG